MNVITGRTPDMSISLVYRSQRYLLPPIDLYIIPLTSRECQLYLMQCLINLQPVLINALFSKKMWGYPPYPPWRGDYKGPFKGCMCAVLWFLTVWPFQNKVRMTDRAFHIRCELGVPSSPHRHPHLESSVT